MRNGEYGLGIDVGDGAVSAAVCGTDGGAVALRLGEGRVTVAVGDDGRVLLVPADGTARTPHLVARVGDPVPVYAGGRAVPAAELVAAAVQRVRELAAQREGRPDAWTVVTVPPSWAGHRCAVLAGALTSAGVPRFSLVSAAVAAVAAHVAAGDLPAEPTVAVHDLGAGMLDTAVVGPTPDQPLAHLAVPPPPLPWGGRDVDDLVVAHVVGCLETPGGDAGALRAACVAAKEALSTATAVRVADGPVRLTREELDEVLLEPAQRAAAVLAATVAAAGVVPEDLDAVVLAGGGVRVPLVAEVLSGELGRPLVVGADPALTPALGAAALAAEAIAAEPPAVEPPPAEPQGVVSAAEEPPRVLPRARIRRDRTRPVKTPGAATRPALRRGGRLGRGAVVTGLVFGLLLLGPAAAGLFDAVLAPTPGGQEAAEADDDGVIARGSAAVGGTSSAARDRTAAGRAEPGAADRPPGSPAGTSLAAAIATAARTGAPSASGSASPTPDGVAQRAPAAATSPPRSAAAGTPATSAPVSSASGTPGSRTPPAPPRPTDPRPVTGKPLGETPVNETPSEGTPTETPVEPEPVDPTPVDPTPTDPEPEPPSTEQPTEEQPPAEPAPSPAGDPATGNADTTSGAA